MDVNIGQTITNDVVEETDVEKSTFLPVNFGITEREKDMYLFRNIVQLLNIIIPFDF